MNSIHIGTDDEWLNFQEQWVAEVFGRDFIGHAADVGANDGIFRSNTLAAEQRGWTVLCVEANPDYEIALRGVRKLVEICACGAETQDAATFFVNDDFPPSASALIDNGHWTRTIQVPVKTLDQLLEQHGFPKVDLLSVDVEHTELDVLHGFDFGRWKPRALLIESLNDQEEQAIRDYVGLFGYRKDKRIETDVAYLLR